MGTDKALLEVGGAPMAVRVADELRAAGAQRVVCVGGAVNELRALGMDAEPDQHPGEGPLGGLLSAFDVTASTALLIAPCDLLAPDASAFARIIETLFDASALAVVPVVGSVRQPLNAAYRQGARGPLQVQFDGGERSVRRALLALDVVELEGIDPSALADADAPDDLEGHR
jgi:molybdopterin-guanine dinucleotide biosynthesis protein A